MAISTPKFNPKKHLLRHSWNQFDKVGIVFDDGKKAYNELIEVNWYFGVLKKDKDKAKKLLEGFSYKMYQHKKFPEYIVVVCHDIKGENGKIQDKYDLPLRLEQNGIQTFEGDLMLDRRWYLDNDIQISDNYRKLYFDIETDDTQEKIEVGKEMILSFAGVDNRGKVFFEMIEDLTPAAEQKLLEKILKIIKQYDLIIGWNSSNFDLPYIKQRVRKHEIKKHNLYQVGHFDLLNRMRHIFRFDTHLRSFSLNFIANHFLKKGKIVRNEKVIELWKTNKEKLKEYNIEDSILVKELDEKMGVTDMMVRQSSWCGVPPSQFGLYSIIDAYIIRSAHKIGKMVKTNLTAIQERSKDHIRGNENPDDTNTDKAKYLGAIVLDPKIGVYDKVYTFDFKGLYPSMMRTSNIGYDTLRYEADDRYITNPGTLHTPRLEGSIKPTYFVKEPSIINLAISDLITKRTTYKDLKLKMIEEGTNSGPEWEKVVSDEIIVKELANSTYGIMGLSYGRYYDVDVAESITLFGQWCITFAKNFFEGCGFNVIYGDTDSVFVDTKNQEINTEALLSQFHFALEEELRKYGIDKSFIQLNFDKEYNKFILFAKKTYAGHCINMEGKKTDEIYVRGLDYIKKSTFGFAATKQRELVYMILKQYYDKDRIKKWAQNVKKEFFNKQFTAQEVTLTNKVGMAFEDYKGKTQPLHVRLAKEIYDKTGENFRNVEVEYIITESFGKTEGILTKDYNGQFDREYYWGNKVAPVLQRITMIIFPDVPDIFDQQLSLF